MSEFEHWLDQESNEIAKAIEPFDVDFEYEKILEWCATNRGLTITWTENGWKLAWKYGYIGFDGLKQEDEAKARKAAALFIYLWTKGVSAGIAERCANGYVLVFDLDRVDRQEMK